MRFERSLPGPNEVFAPGGDPFPHHRPVLDEMGRMGVAGWDDRVRRAHEASLGEQRAFGLSGEDKTHPTDYVPRVTPPAEWDLIERGVAQRMRAINEFLRRLEDGAEEAVPEEVIATSALYDPDLPARFGDVPARQMGFDLVAVRAETGGRGYLFVEDNVKMPVGLVSMGRTRERTIGVLPGSYRALGVRPLDGLLGRFGDCLRTASPKGPDATLAVLSTGPGDQYYLDHHVYAREMDAVLAERHEVELDRGGYLIHKPSGRRLDVIYERIEDGRIYDPLPRLIESHAAGKVHAIFAPNVDVADDKGVYPFVPEMIRRYLGEEPVVENVRTFSLAVEEDRRYVMDRFDELVIKGRSGWGGKDVLIAPEETKESIEEFRRMVEENPVEYVAQEVIDFSTHVLCDTEEEDFVLRDSYADYRVHALCPDPDTIEVVPGAMTRVAAPGSRLVNISSGGKMKDTWVLER